MPHVQMANALQVKQVLFIHLMYSYLMTAARLNDPAGDSGLLAEDFPDNGRPVPAQQVTRMQVIVQQRLNGM